MTLIEMKKTFPDEYIRVGNPTFRATKLEAGYVILHGKDDLELAYQFREINHHFDTFTAIYTGELKKTTDRKWLRFKRLS